MSATLKFVRWFFYNGSPDRRYARRWVFEDDYPPLDVTAGQLLYEDDEGFHVRDADGEAESSRDLEDWQVEPLVVETGNLAWDEAADLYEQGGGIVHQFVAWLEEAEGAAPGLWDLVKAKLDWSLMQPRRASGRVRWRGSIEETVERELAAVGTHAPAREEPDAYDVLIGDRTRPAHEVNPQGHKKYVRLHHQHRRIRAAFNRDMRERGKNCAICGERFKPRRVDQVRCRRCIEAGRKVGD